MYPIKKIIYGVLFVLFFLRKLVQANIFIAGDLLTPGLKIKPDYVRVPLLVKSDFQILLLSNLISMTPGSLVVDVTPDKKEILVHSMYAHDHARVVEEVDEFQVKIKNLFG